MNRAGGNTNNLPSKASEMSDITSDIPKFFYDLLPPGSNERRKTWFYRLSLSLGIKASRIRDLYYGLGVKLWAEELEKIQQVQGVLIEHQITALQRQQDALGARLEALGERHENYSHRRRMGAAGYRASSVRNRARPSTSR